MADNREHIAIVYACGVGNGGCYLEGNSAFALHLKANEKQPSGGKGKYLGGPPREALHFGPYNVPLAIRPCAVSGGDGKVKHNVAASIVLHPRALCSGVSQCRQHSSSMLTRTACPIRLLIYRHTLVQCLPVARRP